MITQLNGYTIRTKILLRFWISLEFKEFCYRLFDISMGTITCGVYGASKNIYRRDLFASSRNSDFKEYNHLK